MLNLVGLVALDDGSRALRVRDFKQFVGTLHIDAELIVGRLEGRRLDASSLLVLILDTPRL